MSGGYRAAVAVEVLKARRSKVPMLTFVAASVAGCIAALFMFIVAHPDQAQRLGLLNQKAQLSGLTADWAGLLSFLAQVIAVGDLLLFSFIATWVFGREFADATMRYLLALPVPRSSIVLAKFTVMAVWSAATTAWLAGLVLVLGWALKLPGASPDLVRHGLVHAAAAAVLMLLATTPFALIACSSRGYLAPLASTAGALILAQVAAVLGWGGVVPWSIPAIAAGLAPDTPLGAAGVLIAVLTGLAGIIGTLTWWRSGQAGL